jgi:hypothetical protein
MDTEPNPKELVTSTPPLPSNIGKTKPLTYIDGSTTTYTVLDEIRRIPLSNPGKALYLQVLQFADDDRKEMRLCYYMIAHRPRMKGKWVFGQFAPMIREEDFRYLIAEAQKRGWV